MQLTQLEKRHYLSGLVFILAMVAVATVARDSELILPEIGALTMGTWIYQKSDWIQRPHQLFLAPSGTAVIGFLINRTSWDYPIKVLVGLGLMLLLLKGLTSPLAPAFATGLLPIIINATHWSFIVAIFFWTLALMSGVYLQRQPRTTSRPVTIQTKQMLAFSLLLLVWVGAVWLAGRPQMAAIPPVIVVLFEVIQKPGYRFKMAAKQWLALVGAASLGVGIHLLIASWLLTTLIALPLVFGWLQLLKLKLPAAYAFPLLALVLPSGMFLTLPLAAALSAAWLLGSVVVYRTVVAYLQTLRSTTDEPEE